MLESLKLSTIISAKAHKDRDELELKLIGTHQAILELCGTTPLQRAGKRVADRKLGELENIWERLISSLREYCKHAGLSLDSEDSKKFIFAKQKMRDEAIRKVEMAQGEDASSVDDGKVKRMNKTVSVLQTEVEFNLPTLEEFSKDAMNSEVFKQAMEMLVDTENKIKRYLDLSPETLKTSWKTLLLKSILRQWMLHIFSMGLNSAN